ncbi:unnamed protein product [Clavelina lepadiformis]|uniref:Legumain n=1 Tax=Clavelina lepadiformis TaxID=159417 RepID=A0ABP0FDJ1_CLALP
MKGSVAFILVFVALSQATFVQQFEKLNRARNNFDGKIWAVVVAGSNGYYNYRHQADTCHAYQVLRNHGIPDEQIVVMMYDDVANSEENPTPGILINHPNGPDVYKGVPKDYTGKDVTPENFLNVLTGNSRAMLGTGSGKVIKSGPNDHVFVYFADHGAPGLIAFPTSELYKNDLNNAIETMHQRKRYKQLVLYVEACESGSMFDNLLKTDINVFATTAANPSESSYACYFDEKRKTYLGDRYSVSWLEDSDNENIEMETLHKQYEVTKKKTNTSHVMQYGDTTISHEIVGFFQGEKPSALNNAPLPPIYDDVPSPDVPIHILQRKIELATSHDDKLKYKVLLEKEQEIRRRISWTVKTIAFHSTEGDKELTELTTLSKPSLNDMECYKAAVQEFDNTCFELDDFEYGYRQIFVLGNLCDAGIPVEKIMSSIRIICH